MNVSKPAAYVRVVRARGGREVGRDGIPGHVGGAARIHGNAVSALDARAAQEGRVDEPGIDHERLRAVVGPQLEAVAVAALQAVAALDRHSLAVDPLVGDRRGVGQRPARRVDLERAAAGQREPAGAGVGEADRVRVGAGGDGELVLELARRAAKAHVDAGPEGRVRELPVGREPLLPLRRVVAAQVAHPARGLTLGGDGRARVRAEEAQLECGRLRPGQLLDRSWRVTARGQVELRWRAKSGVLAAEGHDGLSLGEEEADAAALRLVGDPRIGLTGVRDEVERQLAVGVERTPLGGAVRCRGGAEAAGVRVSGSAWLRASSDCTARRTRPVAASARRQAGSARRARNAIATGLNEEPPTVAEPTSAIRLAPLFFGGHPWPESGDRAGRPLRPSARSSTPQGGG